MDEQLKHSMCAYYDARAFEYDELYAGRIPGTRVDATVYQADAQALRRVVADCCSGALLDAPCGTAFWLSAYAPNVTAVTLIDQSPRMLGQAWERAKAYGIDARCSFEQQDLLELRWADERFDTLLVGFFLSHVELPEEQRFFDGARRALASSKGHLVVLDSSWTDERASTRRKAGRQRRKLSDGREFDIYKSYFDDGDVRRMAEQYGLNARVEYKGPAFMAFSATFEP
jgi:ubiquinone/menaquinone biosynthesis C-methylase UbiE